MLMVTFWGSVTGARLIYIHDGVMRTPNRCFKYDSTRNFHYHIDNIIMSDRNAIIITILGSLKMYIEVQKFSLTIIKICIVGSTKINTF